MDYFRYSYEPFGTACTIDWQDETFEFRSYIMAYFVGGYILPFSVMLHFFRKIISIKREYRQNSVRLGQQDIIESLKRQGEQDITLVSDFDVDRAFNPWGVHSPVEIAFKGGR